MRDRCDQIFNQWVWFLRDTTQHLVEPAKTKNGMQPCEEHSQNKMAKTINK